MPAFSLNDHPPQAGRKLFPPLKPFYPAEVCCYCNQRYIPENSSSTVSLKSKCLLEKQLMPVLGMRQIQKYCRHSSTTGLPKFPPLSTTKMSQFQVHDSS